MRVGADFLILYDHIKSAEQRTINLYSNTVIGTQVVDEWAVTFGKLTARTSLGGRGPAQAPPRCTKCNSPPINSHCGTIIKGLRQDAFSNPETPVDCEDECLFHHESRRETQYRYEIQLIKTDYIVQDRQENKRKVRHKTNIRQTPGRGVVNNYVQPPPRFLFNGKIFTISFHLREIPL